MTVARSEWWDMRFRQVIADVFQLSLRTVNCFLLRTDEGLVLVDCGLPEHGVELLDEVRKVGLGELKHVFVTHCHPDHAGGLALVKAETGAAVWAHPEDAALIEAGTALRPLAPAPGTFNRLLYRAILSRSHSAIPSCQVERRVGNGHLLPGGLIAIHTPGHSAGHLCFFWPERRLLLAGDVASHLGWLRPSPVYEDYATGLASLKKLADLRFEIALFGHGTPIRKEARARFQTRFGALQPSLA